MAVVASSPYNFTPNNFIANSIMFLIEKPHGPVRFVLKVLLV